MGCQSCKCTRMDGNAESSDWRQLMHTACLRPHILRICFGWTKLCDLFVSSMVIHGWWPHAFISPTLSGTFICFRLATALSLGHRKESHHQGLIQAQMRIENEGNQFTLSQPSYGPFGGPNTFQRTLPVTSVQSFWSVPECSVQGWTKSGRHCLRIQNGSKQRPWGDPSGLQLLGSPDWHTNHIMKYCPWSKLWSDQQRVADIEYVEMRWDQAT